MRTVSGRHAVNVAANPTTPMPARAIRRIRRRLLSPLVGSWSELSGDPSRTGVFLDFDGTISAIVLDPAAARPLPGAVYALHALARRYASVAIVSGRPVGFLVDHLELADTTVHAYGLYGLESAVGQARSAHPDAIAWRAALDDF